MELVRKPERPTASTILYLQHIEHRLPFADAVRLIAPRRCC